jgi:hypothetical protein
MHAEVRVGAEHAQPIPWPHPGQRPFDEQMPAGVETQAAEVDFRVGSRQR